jgi:hypothetical protein
MMDRLLDKFPLRVLTPRRRSGQKSRLLPAIDEAGLRANFFALINY